MSEHFVEYLGNEAEIVELDREMVLDALFYRDVSYVVEVPEEFSRTLMRGERPSVRVLSTKEYSAYMAESLVSRYLKVASALAKSSLMEDQVIRELDGILKKTTNVEMTMSVDTDSLERATFYFNFASYSILAGCVYVVCLILASFKSENIRKRTIVSSVDYKKYNLQLLVANGLFALVLWALYGVLGVVLLGKVMLSVHGVWYLVNSFLFTFCALTLAFLIGNLVSNKEAVNGIVNVVALGSSFLCGAFVPMDFLPDAVIRVSHLLPSYYYISSNELLMGIERFDWGNMRVLLGNMGMILVFCVIFIGLSNIVAKRKQRIG